MHVYIHTSSHCIVSSINWPTLTTTQCLLLLPPQTHYYAFKRNMEYDIEKKNKINDDTNMKPTSIAAPNKFVRIGNPSNNTLYIHIHTQSHATAYITTTHLWIGNEWKKNCWDFFCNLPNLVFFTHTKLRINFQTNLFIRILFVNPIVKLVVSWFLCITYSF